MMREDQARKLESLTERIADVVIKEADPWNWPGADVELKDQTQEERGDRYWHKKNAMASLSLLTKLVALGVDWRTKKPGTLPGDEAEDLDDEIKAAEKEASRHLNRVMAGIEKNARTRKT